MAPWKTEIQTNNARKAGPLESEKVRGWAGQSEIVESISQMLVLDLLTRGSTWRVDGCTPARRPTADTQTNHTTRFERLRRCDQLHHSRTCTACMAHGMPRTAFTAHHSRYACTTAQHARYAPYQSSRATRPVQRSPCNVTHAADVVRRATGENTACSMHQATNRRPTGDRLLPPACLPARPPPRSQ